MNRVILYDTTLRDGAQTQGVDFSLVDKCAIAGALDAFGIDIIEAGWPGANPADSALFADLPVLERARFSAFGMTRRPGRATADDPGLKTVLAAGTPVVCLVGKSWDFHVRDALEIPLGENLAMIEDSIAYVVAAGREAAFDAEHFFDGYKADRTYALDCVMRAAEAGARWLVLCDTNGGTLPHEIERIVGDVADRLGGGERIGIHCHDDTGNAVANSLAAVRAGARQIQGTLNGLGERCGNANLTTLIPTLMLKLGFDLGVGEAALGGLTRMSRLLDERLNRAPNPRAPYVGEHAFAHKGGLHASAVAKNARSYEHVPPDRVGNRRHIVISDQAGRASLLARLRDLGIDVDPDDERIATLIALIKEREAAGYAYDGAAASFELLTRAHLGANFREFFRVISFRVVDERHLEADGHAETTSEASVTVEIGGDLRTVAARGNGPVDALDAALRAALEPSFPALHGVHLTDYKVRILSPEAATKAITRVVIESRDGDGRRWTTVGVGSDIINASYTALEESLRYRFLLM